MEFYRRRGKIIRNRTPFKNRFFFVVIFIILILLGASVYAVFFSSLFKIKEINVSGGDNLLKAELTSTLKNYLTEHYQLSEILGADNMLAWKTDLTDFLKTNSQFKNLVIEKDYINKTINISVTQREKYGIWCQQLKTNNETSCWWFDDDGIIFAKGINIEGELLNKVTDFSGKELKTGDRVLDNFLFNNLLKIFKVMESTDIKTRNLYLDDPNLQEIRIESPKPKMFFSLNFSPEFSISAIKSLKESGKWNKLDYIDLRVENRVYYKFR